VPYLGNRTARPFAGDVAASRAPATVAATPREP